MNGFPVTNDYPEPAVCFDFDLTLASGNHADGDPDPGPPVPEMLELARRLQERGWFVIVNSARPVSHDPIIQAWLETYDFYPDQVCCGTKPPADCFVDDKAPKVPLRALEEWIELHRVRELGDQLQMWAKSKLGTPIQDTNWRSWESGGDEEDPQFRVIVPVSGGTDSMTCWAMAEQLGLPAIPVYVDTGASYSAREFSVCTDLIGSEPRFLRFPVDYEKVAHVDIGRNLIILWIIAGYVRDSGWWGEVWFGNTGEWEETPPIGGDKSFRFFGDAQALLTASGFDLRIANPLHGLRKADLVRWWEANRTLAEFAKTRSCYDTGDLGCGRCRSCFRRWLGFAECGQEGWLKDTYIEQDWRDHAEAFWQAPRRGRTTMAPGRTRQAEEALMRHGLGPR